MRPLTDKQMPKGLRVLHLSFYCPYCMRSWARGGKAEGFRKAAATRHVHSCFEYALWKDHGLYYYGWRDGQNYSMTESELRQIPHAWKSTKAMLRRKHKELL